MFKLNAVLLGLLSVLPFAVRAEDGLQVRRVFREARVTRGNTNLERLQPIDDASWIWSPTAPGKSMSSFDWSAKVKGAGAEDPVFLKFVKTFTVTDAAQPLTVDVSADERFYLTVDGRFVARGPHRGTVENWQYQTYELRLTPGTHRLEAVVWRLGDQGPLAQLSHQGGFVLKADGPYDAQLTTGKGSQFEITGRGPYAVEPAAYETAVVVRGPAALPKGRFGWGGRTGGWMLFPSQLPDQLAVHGLPGEIRAWTTNATWCSSNHVYTDGECLKRPVGEVVRDGTITFPAGFRGQIAWDLGRYFCAYPVLRLKGAKGARVSWVWAEAPKHGPKSLKIDRNEIAGCRLEGYGDVFVCDGAEGEFSTPWFRCGRWCRLDVEAGDAPLTVSGLDLVETRYPLELESGFSSPDDPTFAAIREICARAMQMCDHEMLFDCPYYEQQMYPGDTRVQLNVLSAMSRDERMIKRAIEIYDLATRDDGMCPMNFPTRGLQESLSYTLCYLCMYGDYAMNHDDRTWLRARLPGLRRSMAGVEFYENEAGLIANPPGWNFMDWTDGWNWRGTAPGTLEGEGITAELNLFWLLAMQSAAQVETALGNAHQAAYWLEKADRLKRVIRERFWCAERGLLADSGKKADFSEHAQCLAILAGALPEAEEAVMFDHLVSDPDLKRCTVYFSYYLFEAYFKHGRGDLFRKRLDLWRTYVRKGLTTTQEQPDKGPNGEHQSRSDCHAWGSHPIWFMQTGLAGIRSAAPFFARVRVAPCPGGLSALTARHPHPRGWISVDLRFTDAGASGTVETPVPGTFEFGTQRLELKPGLNAIGEGL